MYSLMERLFPICRSITGDGVRETLQIIKEFIPLFIEEVPSGTKVFDWTIPKEWNAKDAWVKYNGKKVIDFKLNNLHLVNYSIPFAGRMDLSELKKHIFTNPNHIPYVTSYYKEIWGFCLKQEDFDRLEEGEYEVFIDTTLIDGSLTYGELLIPGRKKEEVLFSCYICHPSMCNDNLSGTVLLTYLAKELLTRDLEYSYRFLFIPETIGAITWLSRNDVSNIKQGLVCTCVGDPGGLTYKKSRSDSEINKIVEKVLIDSGAEFKIVDFFPMGSDERQFCSPGFNLPIGSLMRSVYNEFAEYHTSGDNLDFVQPSSLEDSFYKYLEVVYILENNKRYVNLNPNCEPNLGSRGLYNLVGGAKGGNNFAVRLLWVLNLSDGENDLLEIAIRSGIKFREIKEAVERLKEVGLVKGV